MADLHRLAPGKTQGFTLHKAYSRAVLLSTANTRQLSYFRSYLPRQLQIPWGYSGRQTCVIRNITYIASYVALLAYSIQFLPINSNQARRMRFKAILRRFKTLLVPDWTIIPFNVKNALKRLKIVLWTQRDLHPRLAQA